MPCRQRSALPRQAALNLQPFSLLLLLPIVPLLPPPPSVLPMPCPPPSAAALLLETHQNKHKKNTAQNTPMLMVACLLMTSGDRGLSSDTTSVLRSCGIAAHTGTQA